MSTCSRCGEPVEFRYIDGQCIPLHLYGGCGQGAASSARDYSAARSSDESQCFQTNCPKCTDPVFFIRHNGGCVWVDPPLGWPWWKHECMYPEQTRGPRVRTSIISTEVIRGYDTPKGLLLGIVKAARPSWDRLNTLIHVLSGADENLILLMKGKAAGFLVGRIVLIDPTAASVTWTEDAVFRFTILTPLVVTEGYLSIVERAICPECPNTVRLDRLTLHLERVHGIAVPQF